jgi:hypothetical protein
MFPLGFKAYPQQIELAQELANAAKSDKVIILESPTGTGKTISLLAGAVQWLNSLQKSDLDDGGIPDWLKDQMNSLESKEFIKENLHPTKKPRVESGDESCLEYINNLPTLVPKVYYASRTHSQLSQVLKELEKFAGQSGTILASRQHLCINEKINRAYKGDLLNDKCHELLVADGCPHFNNRVSKPKLEAFLRESPPISDIEDLIGRGKRMGTLSILCK